MGQHEYPWQRLWELRENPVSRDENGFAPSSDWQRGSAKKLVDIAEKCAALLGEPGIGKSHEFAQYVKNNPLTGFSRIGLNLWSIGSSRELHERLFEHPTVTSWKSGTGSLELVLDSLDEATLGAPTIIAALLEGVERLPVDRLRLRIFSRASEWPSTLEQGFKKLFGDSYAVYLLMPLTADDVRLAAETRGISEADRLMSNIRDADVGALAAIPITLEPLLDVFEVTKNLPRTRVELYREGCAKLVSEPSSYRRDASRRGSRLPRLGIEEKLMLAERIAAVCLFNQRFRILRPDFGPLDKDFDLELGQIAGGRELSAGREVPVDLESLEDVLDTQLFRTIDGRSSWTHRSFVEYLASCYIVRRGITASDYAELAMRFDVLGRRSLMPHLREVTAWLASMNGLIDEVAAHDPAVFLRPSVEIANETRKQLTAELLKVSEAGRLLDRGDVTLRYEVLKHDRLADQIRPYIVDQKKPHDTRRIALKIARACATHELLDDLRTIALDAGDNFDIRTYAARALVAVASNTDSVFQALLDQKNDIDRELEGLAMQAMWPGAIPAEEIFVRLCRPSNDHYFGAFATFVLYNLLRHLTVLDLPVALRWVAGAERLRQKNHHLARLAESLMIHAWRHRDDPDVFESLVDAALARIANHHSILGKSNHQLNEDFVASRTLLRSLLPRMSEIGLKPVHLLRGFPYDPGLLSWVISELETENDANTQNLLAELCACLIPREPDSALIVDQLLAARGRLPALEKATNFLFATMSLSSEEARRQHQWHKEAIESAALVNEEDTRSLNEVIAEVATLLAAFEAGDSDAGWRVQLTLLDHDYLKIDLSSAPAWTLLDSTTQSRFERCAYRYLERFEPSSTWMLEANTFWHPAAAGYRALLFLLRRQSPLLDRISAAVWGKWAWSVLRHATDSDSNDEDAGALEITRRCYEHAPAAFLKALHRILHSHAARMDTPSIVRRLKTSWDGRLQTAIISEASTGDLPMSTVGYVLTEMLPHVQPSAVDASLVLFESFGRSIDIALGMLRGALKLSWPKLWPIFQGDTSVGREVLKRYAHGPESEAGSLAAVAGIEGLADLYIWLRSHFPLTSPAKPLRRGVHEVTEEDSVRRLRDNVLGWIRNAGTLQSVEQMRRILRSEPGALDLKHAVLAAEESCRERIGERHSIADILLFGPVPVIRRRVFRAFIASSADVAEERIEFRECCRRINQSLARQDIQVEPYSFEHDATAAVSDDGPTGVIQPDLEGSHIVVFVVGSRIGEGTQKEIRWALDSRRKRGRPKILIYALDTVPLQLDRDFSDLLIKQSRGAHEQEDPSQPEPREEGGADPRTPRRQEAGVHDLRGERAPAERVLHLDEAAARQRACSVRQWPLTQAGELAGGGAAGGEREASSASGAQRRGDRRGLRGAGQIKKREWGSLTGHWVPHDTRDTVVDFVTRWSETTEIAVERFIGWIGIARGKFFDWKSRCGKVNEHNGLVPRDHWIDEEERHAIIEYHGKHPLEGYRRLAFMMLDADVVAVSPSTVYRVLRHAGLLDRWNGKRSLKGTGFHQPTCVHEHWHIDIAYLNVGGTFYYLCIVLDGFSRMIVHWEIRESMTEQEIECILERAREKFPNARPRIISDNGPQFISRDFKAYIRIAGMTHVRTSPYYPQSNGKLERFNKTIKSEAIRISNPASLDEARSVVERFVEHYNNVRLHSAIGFITPSEHAAGRSPEIWKARDEKLHAARERRRARRNSLSSGVEAA